MLEQQQHQQEQLQALTVTEDHADSDLDTSGDCRDVDLEQAGRSKSTDDCQVPASAPVADQPTTSPCPDLLSDGCDESCNQKQQQLNQEETERSGFVDVNRNRSEDVTTTETLDVVQSGGEESKAVITTADQVTHDYDVPRSTPVREQDDGMCRAARKPRPPPPPPPPNDDNTDDASSTPLDGTPRSQASCSTLTEQQCEPQAAEEPSSATDDNRIRVELSGDMLTVTEPTHMSWEEVLQSAQVLGIPLNPQRPPPVIMTRSDSAAVRRSSTSSSVTSSDRSFVSSPMNSPGGARCRTSAPPVVLPRHLLTRRAVSSSPSTKQPKPKKTGKGASPFREKLHSLFARKGDDHHQSKDRRPSNASPTDRRHRSCSDRTQQRDRRDVVDSSHHPAASGSSISPRIPAEMSPSAAELINCGYRESMLSVLSSSFSSGSLGSIFSHASSSISSNSSSAAATRHHRHQYRHQASSSSSSSSAWRNTIAG